MKKIVKIIGITIAVIIIILLLGLLILSLTQGRQKLGTTDTGIEYRANIQNTDPESVLEQNAYYGVEMPASKLPFVSINVVDVPADNYEALIDNLERQQAGMAMGMDKRYKDTFHFSVQDYGEMKRILWINEFEHPYFNASFEQAAAAEGESGFIPIIREFGTLADSYLWWVSPHVDSSMLPNATNNLAAQLPGDIQTDIESPYSIIPENTASADEQLNIMLEEVAATPGSFYSVSIIETNQADYEALYTNIQQQQAMLYDTFGSSYDQPYHYSVQQYGDTIRVFWLNAFDDSQSAQLQALYKDQPLWDDYMALADNYNWWASQELDERQKAHGGLYQLIKLIKSTL